MSSRQYAHGQSELNWIKSSYSTDTGGNCVEVAARSEAVHVRDSKDMEGPSLAFTPEAWAHFVGFAAGWTV
jgi:hypothetical protein